MAYGTTQMEAYPVATTPAAVADVADQQSAAGSVVAWLKGKWGEFLAVDPQLEDLQHRAAQLAYAASQNGDANTAQLAKASIARLGDLRQLHSRAVAMFESMRDAIPSFSGLGALPVVPLALVATVLALGAMVTYILSRESAEEKIVDGLNAGTMTPALAQALLDQAAQNPDKLSEFSSAVKWIVGGVLGFMVLKTVRELMV